jgi:tRNA threonylcarbamoyladenosine biosynthesis protein TsaE
VVKEMVKKYDLKLNNLEETYELAIKLGQHLFPGAIITLEGDLGAGKTTFTKGIAKGLKVKQTVNSPTFTIIKEYSGELNLYHIDAYRLEDSLEDLGFDEYFYGDGVTVIEWGSKIKEQIPEQRLHICLYPMSETVRVIECFPLNEKYEAICEVIFNEPTLY